MALDFEKKFKIKYILIVLVVVGLVTVIIGGGIYQTIRSEVSYRLADMSEQGLTTAVIFSEVNNFLVVLIPVLLIIVVFISFLLFGRIASPVHLLIKEIQALGKGDFTADVDAKQGGELADLVKVVHDTKQSLSRMIIKEKDLIDDVLVTANNLLKELEKDKINKEKVTQLLKYLQSGLDEIQITISKYKINK